MFCTDCGNEAVYINISTKDTYCVPCLMKKLRGMNRSDIAKLSCRNADWIWKISGKLEEKNLAWKDDNGRWRYDEKATDYINNKYKKYNKS